MQGASLSFQERECKLYDEFDEFTYVKGVAASRLLSTKNQLRTSYNLRNQAAIQDGRVTVQQVQRRQVQSYAGIRNKGNATSSGGNNAGGQARVVKWIPDGKVVQTVIPNNAAFQTDDLDAYDSDCNDVSAVKAVLMANLSNYDSDVLSEVPHFKTYQNDMDNQSVQGMQHFKQTHVDDYPDNEKAQQIKPTLYDGSVISRKHDVIPMADKEETLILEELNQLSGDFGKCFVPKQELCKITYNGNENGWDTFVWLWVNLEWKDIVSSRVSWRLSVAKVLVYGRTFSSWADGDKDDFVYEGFSKNHFSKVAIDNATGIFQYHEVAFVGMSLEDMTDYAGNFDVVQAVGSYPSLYPRRSRIL
ncbi:hypothetical protein Tco_0963894 [Tanacetum coccineum]